MTSREALGKPWPVDQVHLVIPETHEGQRGAGQWKDLHGIRLVLDEIGVDWTEFRLNVRNLEDLVGRIGSRRSTIIWYYSFWPEALEELKARCPGVRIVLRTVNAESFQHWSRARKDWSRFRGLPRDVYGFVRYLRRDRRCARAADFLAGISPWDDLRYWKHLASAKITRPAPYVCPWPALLPDVKPVPWEARENTIACLAGSRDRIGRGHLAHFAALAMSPELSDWHFVASAGFMDASRDELPARVQRLGQIAEPWPLLCSVKAVAVLSPLGRGYKTTVADGLAAGCRVLVHPRQHARLSREEQAATLAVDPASDADVGYAADALRHPPALEADSAWAGQRARGVAAWRALLAT